MRKLWEVCRFEIAYQTARPLTCVYPIALFLITLQISLEGFRTNARDGGYFFNSSFVVEQLTILTGGMALLVIAALSGESAARDVQTRMSALIYTSPVSKTAYLGGRFLAAFLMSAVVMLCPQLALLLASFLSGSLPDIIGPFDARIYLVAYFVVALPNAFVATALFFSAAILSRKAIAGYLGATLLIFFTIVSWAFLALKLNQWEVAKLFDPLGLTMLAEFSRTARPVDKNLVSVASNSSFWLNRLLWLGIATIAIAFTALRFRFEHAVARPLMRRRLNVNSLSAANEAGPSDRLRNHAAPKVNRYFGWNTRRRQLVTIALQSFRQVALSWGGLILVGLTLSVVSLGPQTLSHMGVPLLPTTHLLTAWVGGQGEILWMIVPFLTVFYVGELMWRERETGLSEIVDATPVPEWVRFLGKYAGMALVFLAYQLLLISACVLIQVQLGYRTFEPLLYVKVMLGLGLAEHLLFAAMVFAVHTLVNHKYAGHMVVLLAYGFTNFSAAIGVHHHLLIYGSDPGWQYSDFNGFGPYVAPLVWFKLYWASCALLLAVITHLWWVRGRENTLAARWQLVRRRFSRPTAALATASILLIATLGGFIFYNTNVLNAYDSPSDVAARSVDYERLYGQFKGRPQPSLNGVKLRIELYPERREAEMHTTYRVINKSGGSIDSIHLATQTGVETGAVEFDRPASEVVSDDRLNFRIYALKSPLNPGDSMQLSFVVRFKPVGFTNGLRDASVVQNGTYLEGNRWLPAIGYQTERELANARERLALGLPKREVQRSASDSAIRYDMSGAQRIAFEAVVGTSFGETAVAPGALKRTWTEQGRRYFEYVANAPIRNDFAVYSAKYAMREWRSGDVQIQLYHLPQHDLNVAHIEQSMKASLEVLSRKLGPYPYTQLRLVEHPGQGNSLHASPINVSYEEEFSLMNSAADSRQLDFPFAIVAHEIAHQWWGDQLTPARAEGRSLLTESLAWYSSMTVLEETLGDEQLRSLLELMRETYLSPRERAGPPLIRADDQFTAYRKGPFAMYAMREYIGASQVDSALRRLMRKHSAGTAPLATSLDLYEELHAVTPDSLRYLLVDMFDVNTYWELQTRSAVAEAIDGNKWRVTLNVNAKKVAVDTAGVSTELPMNDLIEIGVYAHARDGKRGLPLYQRLHRVRAGDQQLTIEVPTEPGSAGIDPRSLLIDTKWEDNVKEVTSPRGRP